MAAAAQAARAVREAAATAVDATVEEGRAAVLRAAAHVAEAAWEAVGTAVVATEPETLAAMETVPGLVELSALFFGSLSK